jgi:hypothetical protein
MTILGCPADAPRCAAFQQWNGNTSRAADAA